MPDDDLESRFSRLEHQVSRLREDVLNALRETQLEQGKQIDELRQEMHQEIGGLRREMHQEISGLRQEMREGFTMQSTGMAQIVELLTTIADHKQ